MEQNSRAVCDTFADFASVVGAGRQPGILAVIYPVIMWSVIVAEALACGHGQLLTGYAPVVHSLILSSVRLNVSNILYLFTSLSLSLSLPLAHSILIDCAPDFNDCACHLLGSTGRGLHIGVFCMSITN